MKNKKTTLHELALNLLREQGVTEGTKVRIIGTSTDHAHGWNNSWMSEMDQFVGKIVTVDSLWEHGVSIKESTYQYPAFVCSIEDRTMEVKINKDYMGELNFTERTLKVGCQTISFKKIAELYDLCQKQD